MTRTALITGASRGIGKVIAERFAKEGIRVIIASKSVKENPDLPGTIFSVKEEIGEKYPQSEVYPFQLDVLQKNIVVSNVLLSLAFLKYFSRKKYLCISNV